MPSALPAVLGAAGATVFSRLRGSENRRQRGKDFEQSMALGEKYGIHPLQMLGHAGTLSGTGGWNMGNILANEAQTRRANKRQDKIRAQENKRADDTREDQQAHEIVLQNMKLEAEAKRLERQLEEEGRDPDFGKWIRALGSGFDEVDQMAERNRKWLTEKVRRGLGTASPGMRRIDLPYP
jgi:hypothetical protein